MVHSTKNHDIKWPAQSSDFNPMENLWEIVDKNICITNKANVFEQFKNFWNNIDEEINSNIISSMPKRSENVIANKERNIKY